MRKTILTSLIVLMFATPCLAQDKEPIKGIEGTVWHFRPSCMGPCPGSLLGFYDGHVYYYNARVSDCFHPYIPDTGTYIDLPGIGLFWYNDYCLQGTLLPVCQWRVGMLFPLIGKGIHSCIVLPCFLSDKELRLIPDKSLPEDFCPTGVWYIFPNWSHQGRSLMGVSLYGISTTFQDNPPVEITFDPPAGLTISNIDVISNTELAFDLEIAVDAPVGYRNVIVTYDDGNMIAEKEDGFMLK